MDDRGGEGGVDQIGGLVEPAAMHDGVVGVLGCRGDPFPGRLAADTPAGLVHRHHRRRVDPRSDVGGHRHQVGGGGLRRLADRPRGHREPEPLGEEAGDLGEGDPQAVVQIRRPRLGARPDLGACRAQRIGGLLNVAPLHPLTAALAPAAADRHVEPGRLRRRQRRQVGLELLGVTNAFDLAATIRTTRGQRGLQCALRVRWWLAMPVAAMSLTALASRALRLIDRIPMSERRRLTLPRPASLLEQLLQLGDPSVTLRHHLIALRQRLLQAGDHRLQASHNLRQVRFGITSRTRNGRLRSLGSTHFDTARSAHRGGGPRYPMTVGGAPWNATQLLHIDMDHDQRDPGPAYVAS